MLDLVLEETQASCLHSVSPLARDPWSVPQMGGDTGGTLVSEGPFEPPLIRTSGTSPNNIGGKAFR